MHDIHPVRVHIGAVKASKKAQPSVDAIISTTIDHDSPTTKRRTVAPASVVFEVGECGLC